MRQQDKDLTLGGVGGDVAVQARRGEGGLDGQLHSTAEAEVSLKNGAWPISKGQRPEH